MELNCIKLGNNYYLHLDGNDGGSIEFKGATWENSVNHVDWKTGIRAAW